MNTNQKYYTAFMESICNHFKCMDALPALNEGFNALCESEAFNSQTGELKRYQGSVVFVDQKNFFTDKPLDELTEADMEKYLDDWMPLKRHDGTATDALEEFKRRQHVGNGKVLVDTPNKFVIIDSFSSRGDGTYQGHVRGMKIENKAGEPMEEDYAWKFKPEDRSLIRNDRRGLQKKIDDEKAWADRKQRELREMTRFLAQKGLLAEYFENQGYPPEMIDKLQELHNPDRFKTPTANHFSTGAFNEDNL